MTIRVASLLLLLGATLAAAQCPQVHVFGAREKIAPLGYGTAVSVPACDGQGSCGSVSYASSAVQGVAAVANQVKAFNMQCPNTVLVLVGYSQGGQIMDGVYCGGGDTNEGLSNTAIPISAAAQKIAAHSGFQCPYGSHIQSYCDAAHPYCCNGSDTNTHQGYAVEYGAAAQRLRAGGTETTTTATVTSTGGSGTVPRWGQCSGMGWTGGTICQAPYTRQAANAYVSSPLVEMKWSSFY
ncbi:putative acetyl xylan esterase [Mycena vulgaris]|nr:putative acetyl xylan esterase [Mycena vulgaris]